MEKSSDQLYVIQNSSILLELLCWISLKGKRLSYKAGIKIILQMLIISDYYLYLRYKFILKITSYFDIISLRQYNFVVKNNSPLRIYYWSKDILFGLDK